MTQANNQANLTENSAQDSGVTNNLKELEENIVQGTNVPIKQNSQKTVRKILTKQAI